MLQRHALSAMTASHRRIVESVLDDPDHVLRVADLYGDALDRSGGGAERAIAISGLAEVGTRDDAALISFLTSSPSVPIAEAAIRACAPRST